MPAACSDLVSLLAATYALTARSSASKLGCLKLLAASNGWTIIAVSSAGRAFDSLLGGESVRKGLSCARILTSLTSAPSPASVCPSLQVQKHHLPDL